jgi:hypothetical protein
VPDSSTPATLVRGQDTSYAWNGGANTELVQITIADPEGKVVRCDFPDGAGAGTGTIPGAALAQLDPGAGTFTAVVYTTQAVDAGSYSLDVNLVVVAVAASGDWAKGAVTLQ